MGDNQSYLDDFKEAIDTLNVIGDPNVHIKHVEMSQTSIDILKSFCEEPENSENPLSLPIIGEIIIHLNNNLKIGEYITYTQNQWEEKTNV